jgi:hypothetical protein
VGGAFYHVWERLPVPLRGLDSDNGSEFINHGLWDWCHRHQITFTRSRAWKKNDNAHVEQKNGAVVRNLVGDDRFASRAAHAHLRRVYALARLHLNFFQPVEKLVTKPGPALAHRVYDCPKRRTNASAPRACYRRARAPTSTPWTIASIRSSCGMISKRLSNVSGPWLHPTRGAHPGISPRSPSLNARPGAS